MKWNRWLLGLPLLFVACGTASPEEELIEGMCDCYTPVMERQEALFDSVKDSLPDEEINQQVENLMIARMQMGNCVEKLDPLRKQVGLSDSMLSVSMKEQCPAVVAFYNGLAKNPID